MKKNRILAIILTVALASMLSVALVGCGGGEKSSGGANSPEDIAKELQKEDQATKDKANAAAGNASKGTGTVGEPIEVTTDDGNFSITIDRAFITTKYSYAGDKGAAKLYYTIENESCSDSEIPLRELMVVTDNDGAVATAEPDAKPSENPGVVSAPNGIPDCAIGETENFVTYYSVTKGATSLTIKVGGYSIEVPLEVVEV